MITATATKVKTTYNTAPFFVNTTSILGILEKGEPVEGVQPIYIINGTGRMIVFVELADEYLTKKLAEIEEGSTVTVEASIKQFPNGHYLVAQSFEQQISTASGVVIRVDEPREHNGRMVVNFAISQSLGKDDTKSTIIDCSYWYKPGSTAISSKIRKGAFVAVSGSLKFGSYTNLEGQEISTLGIDVRHVASPRSGGSTGAMALSIPGSTKKIVTTPVTGGDDIDF